MSISYSDAVQRLLWLGHEGRSLKWDLENIRRVLERLGHPERRFASVHIAGTNGKGSVAAMLASVLRCAGYRVGLYTSPHLVRINERIAVDGTALPDADFAAAFVIVSDAIESLLAEGALPQHPSYFECLTAMALWYFAQAGVEIAVLEVGLGGRLDATNVVTPEVAVLTPIDFDHERYLGHAIEQIAAEKAGILKAGVPVVSAAAHPQARTVVKTRAAELGGLLVDVDAEYGAEELRAADFGLYRFVARARDGFTLPISLALRGAHQVGNALTTVATARLLSERGWTIPVEVIAGGIAATGWPGRLQLVCRHPLTFLDGAHNPAGARQLARFCDDHLGERALHVVFGSVRDKAVEEVAEQLFPRAASVTVTQPPTPRAAGCDFLARVARSFCGDVAVEPDPAAALAGATGRAAPDGAVLVTGSLFLVGDCLRAIEAAAQPGWAGPVASAARA
jgi:dihydrofolate synthase/folylpolyglutamate synthase